MKIWSMIFHNLRVEQILVKLTNQLTPIIKCKMIVSIFSNLRTKSRIKTTLKMYFSKNNKIVLVKPHIKLLLVTFSQKDPLYQISIKKQLQLLNLIHKLRLISKETNKKIMINSNKIFLLKSNQKKWWLMILLMKYLSIV